MISQAQDRGTHTIYHVVQINLVISTHRDAGMLLADTNDYTFYKYEEAGVGQSYTSPHYISICLTSALTEAVNIVLCCEANKPSFTTVDIIHYTACSTRHRATVSSGQRPRRWLVTSDHAILAALATCPVAAPPLLYILTQTHDIMISS